MKSIKSSYFWLATGLLGLCLGHQFSLEFIELSRLLYAVSMLLIVASFFVGLFSKESTERKIGLSLALLVILLSSFFIKKKILDPLLYHNYGNRQLENLRELSDLILEDSNVKSISLSEYGDLAVQVDCKTAVLLDEQQEKELGRLMEGGKIEYLSKVFIKKQQDSTTEGASAFIDLNEIEDSVLLLKIDALKGFLIKHIGHQNCIVDFKEKKIRLNCTMQKYYPESIRQRFIVLMKKTGIKTIDKEAAKLAFSFGNYLIFIYKPLVANHNDYRYYHNIANEFYLNEHTY